ncbi:hypothetical protein J6J28_04405 [Pseudidiomarina sp. 1ASP75-5]|nr:hypothetical protein [Pseudidiomarina sp. 1ASP75-5]
MTLYLILIAGYMLVCIAAVRAYFYCQNKLKSYKDSLPLTLLSYMFFFVFILIEIPFAIFFPAWLSERFSVIERTSNNTMLLLLFGVFTLAFSIWQGRSAHCNLPRKPE